jgi:uncharacterized protein (DUF433 family)
VCQSSRFPGSAPPVLWSGRFRSHACPQRPGPSCVAGTRTRVLEVALDHLAYGWDAEEIRRQHPSLSLPQIHAALGYYFENQAECDAAIDRELREVDALRDDLQSSSLQARLRTLKRNS